MMMTREVQYSNIATLPNFLVGRCLVSGLRAIRIQASGHRQ